MWDQFYWVRIDFLLHPAYTVVFDKEITSEAQHEHCAQGASGQRKGKRQWNRPRNGPGLLEKRQS